MNTSQQPDWRFLWLPSVCGLLALLVSDIVMGQISPITACAKSGIGSVKVKADSPVTIVSVESAKTSSAVPYCLVKVHVPQAINIWVGLPMAGHWNGRLQSEGGGGYAGFIDIPVSSINDGYIGVQTDTGHAYSSADDVETQEKMGDFALLSPGVPNTPLQNDFAYRSEHLMAVVGKQLADKFYGRPPIYSYWNGCSTGGRQGLRMAQSFPADYDGVLAGAPAIYFAEFQAYQLWPQIVMKELTGGPIAQAKQELAIRAAITNCDSMDNVVDGLISDPRQCHYSATGDRTITRASCTAADRTCLTPIEAQAIDRIWNGATNLRGDVLWPGLERGASLSHVAGLTAAPIAVNQGRYWVFLDPAWNWRTVTLANFEAFFEKTVQMVSPTMATEKADLSVFRARGGKIISWHGFNDQHIMPRGSIKYYEAVAQYFGKGYDDVHQFYRLFLAPGVAHCGGGDAPQPQNLLQALVSWVERGRAPDRVLAAQTLGGGMTRTRPLCPYPLFAQYNGSGSTDNAANFGCVVQ